ncbi:MAG: alkaline phosphatase family protein [Candidatus Krumholzibacteriia bacterium]
MKQRAIIALALAAAVVGLVSALVVRRVPQGYQAVRIGDDGEATSYGRGLHFVPPFSARWLLYPAGEVEYRFPDEGVYSLLGKEGGKAHLALGLRMRVPDRAGALIQPLVGDEFYAGLSRIVRETVEIETARWPLVTGGAMPAGYDKAVIGEVIKALTPAGLEVAEYRLEGWRSGGEAPVVAVEPEPLRKVLFVGVDGADWDILRAMMAGDRLPNFRKIVEGGTSGPLRSIEPLLSPLIWTTVATGKLPEDHGVLNFTVVDPKTGKKVPISRRARRVDAFWNMLSDAGRRVSIVGWLATFPAEAINGTMVTDRVGYLAYADAADDSAVLPGSVSPAERLAEISELVLPSESVTYDEFKPFIDIDRDTFLKNRASAFDPKNPINSMIMLYASTLSYHRIAMELLGPEQPDFLAVYFELVDATKHLFMHYAPPRLPDTDDTAYRKFKNAVAEAYVLQDRIIGELLEKCDDRTVVIVASDHGFKSGALRPRLRPEIWAGKAAFWHKLDGIICLYGNGIRPGRRIENASVLDVTPTVLGLQGLPVPADMPGKVLSEALEEPLVERLNTTRLATLQRTRTNDAESFEADDEAAEQVMKKLEALAYITPERTGSGNPDAHNNLGQRYQEKGEYRKAVEEFNKALSLRPDFPAALNNLGVCYGKLKQYDLARQAFERAIELNPENVFAMNNLAIMFLQLGELDAAHRYGARAVRVEPNYSNGHITLGSVYANMGEFERAEKEFVKALEIDPSNRNAQVNLERVRADLERNEP